jgi:hypothetical protein
MARRFSCLPTLAIIRNLHRLRGRYARCRSVAGAGVVAYSESARVRDICHHRPQGGDPWMNSIYRRRLRLLAHSVYLMMHSLTYGPPQEQAEN